VAVARSKSSRRWLDRHHRDAFVQRARQEGYRSRAAYKLLEIQERDRVLRPGQCVVDLGAAPGGWSQVARRIVGDSGCVVALDLLAMEALPGVAFIQADFREEKALALLRDSIGERDVDLVISDMAPNSSGVSAVDQPRAMYLAELALDLAEQVLRPGGGLVVKVFQGEGFDAFFKQAKAHFERVVTRKPKASRSRSREVYLVAGNLKV
jgi:23S rRNA (uridine2552-2'-O)-methyltransferase